MHPALRTFIVFLQICGGIALIAIIAFLLALVGPAMEIFGDVVLVLSNSWAIYAFMRYRQGRREELAQVLAAAASAGAPLAPAVTSYLTDRPSQSWPRIVLETLSWFLMPLYGYVRLCVGPARFNRLVEQLAERLQTGEPLSKALRRVPGVSSRSFRLAAAVGESTGALGQCLRSATEESGTVAWVEIAPRIIYPFVVLLFVGLLSIVIWVKIIPKFERIFADFGQKLPAVTQTFASFYAGIDQNAELLLAAAALGVIVVAALIASPAARWRMPLFGRMYRWSVQGEILRALGMLLAAGQTVVRALELLRSSKDLPLVVQRRLALAMAGVERGESLDAALEQAELLPLAMGPLVRSAERTRTLPWAMEELGGHLAGRALRLMRRVSLLAAPLMIVAVGSLVAFTALTVFMPIVRLMWSIE